MAAKWVTANPEAAQRNFGLEAKRVKLPMQDNHCACGLFLLTFLDFFTYGLPDNLSLNIRSNKPLKPSELLGALSSILIVISITYQGFLQHCIS